MKKILLIDNFMANLSGFQDYLRDKLKGSEISLETFDLSDNTERYDFFLTPVSSDGIMGHLRGLPQEWKRKNGTTGSKVILLNIDPYYSPNPKSLIAGVDDIISSDDLSNKYSKKFKELFGELL